MSDQRPAGDGPSADRRGRDPVRGARARLRGRAARRRRPQRPRRDAPQRRPRHGRGRPGPLPGHGAGHRAGHRGRLLLRLQAAPPADARGPGRDRGADGGQRRRGPSVRPPRAAAGRGPGALRRAQAAVQGRDPRRPRAERRPTTGRRCRRSSLYEHGPFSDLCKGPHVASTRQDRPVQAARARRRLLARRREAADAPADLRHGLGDAGGARAVPVATRRGEEARPPPARRPARPVQLPRRQPGLGLLAPQGPDDLADARRRDARAPGCAAATRRSARRSSSTRSSGSSRATGTCTTRTCSGSSRRARRSPSSR